MNNVHSSSSHPSSPVLSMDWNRIHENSKKVKEFLKSFHVDRIGTGLMRVDENGYTLSPRSNYVNSPTVQRALNIRNPLATYEAVQRCFNDISRKIDVLEKFISAFDPDSGDCVQAKKLLLRLVKINRIFETTAFEGIEQLCKNYISDGQADKAGALKVSGDGYHVLLKRIIEALTHKLSARIEELDVDIKLVKYNFSAAKLLIKRGDAVLHLRSVFCNFKVGCIIPTELIQDCLTDQHKFKDTDKKAMQIATNQIGLPTLASKIPTQGGNANWVPMRLIETEERSILVERGVVGTCERDSAKKLSDLCNVYYRIESDSLNCFISCGAVNNAQKAKELAQVIKLMEEPLKKKQKQFVLHQLGSFKAEEEIIRNAHTHIAETESLLRTICEDDELSILHINTNFNATNWFDSERTNSLSINCQGLARLAKHILMKVDQLNPFNIKDAAFFESARELKETFDCQIQRLINVIAFIEKEPESIKNTIEAKNTIEVKQKELERELEKYLKNLDEALAKIDPSLVRNYEEETLLLLLDILRRLIHLQFTPLHLPRLSRSAEIELYLLLYRMLDMTPILICWSGLDRSGAVRALAESQARLERELKQRVPQGAVDLAKQPSPLNAWKMIFRLILHCDDYRKELFSLTEAISQENSSLTMIANLDKWQALESQPFLLKDEDASFRKMLFEKIDQMYEDKEKADDLKLVQYYLELVVSQLLGSEAEKTFYSTGMIGFKYHHNGSLTQRMGANNYPLERWPQFISDHQGCVIQLLSDPMTITEAAKTLILRLAYLRGG
ncbi:hypothetical protein [Candidatus Protochlamydia phocaeensis]|uniref:hypothetical protein n=1 Tax=Candidatus Protochlamydia phocaeensis TaxID=1414722 RepID=UPI000838C442|nr:hypothetical protein [Candidatus Protochlamydia phocaeensis]